MNENGKVYNWEMTNTYLLLDPENSVASVKAKYEKMQKRSYFYSFKVKFYNTLRRTT